MKKLFFVRFCYRTRRRWLWRTVWSAWSEPESLFFAHDFGGTSDDDFFSWTTVEDDIKNACELIAHEKEMRIGTENIDIYLDKVTPLI